MARLEAAALDCGLAVHVLVEEILHGWLAERECWHDGTDPAVAAPTPPAPPLAALVAADEGDDDAP
jgi:hypothetical protein